MIYLYTFTAYFGCKFFFHHIRILNMFVSLFIDLLRDINDPEHPMSLEELNVVQISNIEVV